MEGFNYNSKKDWIEALLSHHKRGKMNKKILIGLSTGENIRRADFLPYLIGMNKSDGTAMSICTGQSPAKSRNILARQALDNGFTHIFFVDDDMVLQPDTLLKLEKHDVDIVTGLYLLRGFPHYPAIFDEAFESGACKFAFLQKQEGLIEVVNAGLGCVLISVEVFKRLEEPWVRLGEIEKDGWCDDVGFFNRCRQAGFRLYCDTSATVGHMSGVTIWPEQHPDPTDGGKIWMTNYKHINGNVLISQNIPLSEELQKAREKDKLILSV